MSASEMSEDGTTQDSVPPSPNFDSLPDRPDLKAKADDYLERYVEEYNRAEELSKKVAKAEKKVKSTQAEIALAQLAIKRLQGTERNLEKLHLEEQAKAKTEAKKAERLHKELVLAQVVRDSHADEVVKLKVEATKWKLLADELTKSKAEVAAPHDKMVEETGESDGEESDGEESEGEESDGEESDGEESDGDGVAKWEGEVSSCPTRLKEGAKSEAEAQELNNKTADELEHGKAEAAESNTAVLQEATARYKRAEASLDVALNYLETVRTDRDSWRASEQKKTEMLTEAKVLCDVLEWQAEKYGWPDSVAAYYGEFLRDLATALECED